MRHVVELNSENRSHVVVIDHERRESGVEDLIGLAQFSKYIQHSSLLSGMEVHPRFIKKKNCLALFLIITPTTEIYTLSLHDALPIAAPIASRTAISRC